MKSKNLIPRGSKSESILTKKQDTGPLQDVRSPAQALCRGTKIFKKKKKERKKDQKGRDFLGCSPIVKTPPMEGVRVRSLVGELRSHTLCSTAKK